MPRKVAEIVDLLELNYPKSLAEKYDNPGLILGNPNSEVTKILVCLDITSKIIDEANYIGAQMIIAHHPLIFKPIKNIIFKDTSTSPLVSAIKNQLNIFALHTNFDNASGGMNDILIEKLELNKCDMPQNCTVRCGELNSPMNLRQYAVLVKDLLKVDIVKITGNPNKIIKKVGIVGGSGADYIDDAIMSGCDVLITGDVKHHDALYALERGFSIIDASHFYTEIIFITYICDFLLQLSDIDVVATKVDTNPFLYI